MRIAGGTVMSSLGVEGGWGRRKGEDLRYEGGSEGAEG